MGAVRPFRRPRGPLKRERGTIPRDRTENRHRCPWVRSPRRLGDNPGQEGREFSMLVFTLVDRPVQERIALGTDASPSQI